jgi:nucleoside-diphosphate-sugar epimerase
VTEPQTVLVTGAAGQVGRRVVELLLARGRTVVALDLPTDKARRVLAARAPAAGAPGRLIPSYTDVQDRAAVLDLFARHQPEAVVHLAAILSPTCYGDPAGAWLVNVEGTRNVVDAATSLPQPPALLLASSAAVYGSRNPHRHADRLTPATPPNPSDCYGEQKLAAEGLVAGSGLPHALLRLGGIISPDATENADVHYLLLVRATPWDNRVHMVDARDVALAFVNGVDRIADIDGRRLLIAGDDSHLMTHSQVQDDVFAAMGLGGLGPDAGLRGDPDDDGGWGLTDWFDTSESQRLLQFQRYTWPETLAWLAQAQGWRRTLARIAGPVVRPALRTALRVQQRREGRGPYADPWRLVARTYGPAAVAGHHPSTTVRQEEES